MSPALLAANANEEVAQSGPAVALGTDRCDLYRRSDPRRGLGLSWHAWAGTLVLHGGLALIALSIVATARPTPPALPDTITVVFEAPAASAVQPPPVPTPEPVPPPAAAETAPPAPTQPQMPAVPPAPPRAAAKATAAPTPVAVLPLPPPAPPRPPIARPPAPAPVPRATASVAPMTAPPTAATAQPASTPTQVAIVPVIPPRPASGLASNRKPAYPLAARSRRLQGRVVLQVEVAASGDPTSVRVVSSSGYALLDQSAREAVQAWHFVPASQAGRAVAGTVDVPVDFRMVD